MEDEIYWKKRLFIVFPLFMFKHKIKKKKLKIYFKKYIFLSIRKHSVGKTQILLVC